MKRQLPKLRHFSDDEILPIIPDLDSLSQKEYENLLVLLHKVNATRHEMGELYPKISFHPIDIRKYLRKNNSTHNLFCAMDFYISGCKVNNVLINRLEQVSHDCAFKGFGVYLNEKGYYSFHLDSRNSFKNWTGTKKRHEDAWTYGVFKFF